MGRIFHPFFLLLPFFSAFHSFSVFFFFFLFLCVAVVFLLDSFLSVSFVSVCLLHVFTPVKTSLHRYMGQERYAGVFRVFLLSVYLLHVLTPVKTSLHRYTGKGNMPGCFVCFFCLCVYYMFLSDKNLST